VEVIRLNPPSHSETISLSPAPTSSIGHQIETISLSPAAAPVIELSASVSITQASVEVIRSVSSSSANHLIGSGEQWQQVRDYVVESIQARWGMSPRNLVKESAIFKGFCQRWGDKAMPIARAAVELHNCQWKSTPLSVQRFCKNSDPYFSEVISSNIK